jgi:N-acetylglutamate synthase-like GNAT family acetyltransferase
MERIIRIIPFSAHHQPGITALNTRIQQEFAEPFTSPSAKTILELSQNSGEFFWTALHRETVVGTVGLALLTGHRAVLKRMAVDRKYRGKQAGLSKRLLDTALSFARSNRVKTIFLGTMSQFVAARHFYLRSGFIGIEKSQVPLDYTFNPVDTVFFKLELHEP